MLIGLVGRAQSGKTTVAKHLEEKYGFVRHAFADPLKQMLLNAKMCTYDELYHEKTTMSRWLLQKIGTDIFREQVSKDYWTNKMGKFLMDNIWEKKNIVIDDIRFPEEAGLIYRFHGTVIKLIRMDYFDPNGDGHVSENLIEEIWADYILKAKSGDLEGLVGQVETCLELGLDCRKVDNRG